MKDTLQAFILVVTSLVLFLLSCKSRRCRYWGGVLGVLHEPAWLYVTWMAGQWGMFVLSCFCLFSYARAAWNNRGLAKGGLINWNNAERLNRGLGALHCGPETLVPRVWIGPAAQDSEVRRRLLEGSFKPPLNDSGARYGGDDDLARKIRDHTPSVFEGTKPDDGTGPAGTYTAGPNP